MKAPVPTVAAAYALALLALLGLGRAGRVENAEMRKPPVLETIDVCPATAEYPRNSEGDIALLTYCRSGLRLARIPIGWFYGE